MKKILMVLTSTVVVFSICLKALAAEKITPLTATASSSWSSYTPASTVDGSMSTRWLGNFSGSPWWIKFDTGKINSLGEANTYWYENYAAGSYDILVSSDNVNWTAVYSGLRGVTGGDTKVINREGRYIMLKIYSTQGSPMPGIKEFEAYRSVAPANQPPVAQASANPTSGYAPLTVQFTGSGTDSDGYIVSYQWAFGDGGSSGQQNPSHAYQTAGTYTATLIITDDDSAADDATVTINVGEAPSQGSVPHLMRFQGNLGDRDGQPIEGIYTFTFRIYSSEAGGAPIWTETQVNIDIEKGFLDVVLGSVTSLNISFDRQYWLSVEVESNGEMTPRFMLTTVPYSFTSEK